MDLEKKKKEFLRKHWPFVTSDFDYFFELKYNCIHCGRDGLIKNYRTIENDGTWIMCEYEDCDGTAIDMMIVDEIEEELHKIWQKEGRKEWNDDEWDRRYAELKKIKEQGKKV